MIEDHITQWFGLPVEEFGPNAVYGTKIYRFGFSYETEDSFDPDALAKYLDDHRVETIKAIVLGMPGEAGETFEKTIEVLVANSAKLTGLRGIFLGDIIQEENEMSWIEQGDVGKILAAFPHLEELRVRGGQGLSITPTTNPGLKRLIIETGGMPKSVLQSLAKCKLPKLEHLELWLGDDGYGWDGSLEDIKPLIEPGLFPSLKSLGLSNSVIQNEIAAAIADAPILDQLASLDLSKGVLTDEGAKPLLASARVRQLPSLDLHHNYLTEATIKLFNMMDTKVNTADQQEPDVWDGEANYYVAVGE
jgi:hypothetical protein